MTYQNTHNFGVNMFCPTVCAAYHTIPWFLSAMGVWGFLTCQADRLTADVLFKWRAVAAVSAVCSHYLLLPPLTQPVKAWGRCWNQPLFSTLWVDWTIRQLLASSPHCSNFTNEWQMSSTGAPRFCLLIKSAPVIKPSRYKRGPSFSSHYPVL